MQDVHSGPGTSPSPGCGALALVEEKLYVEPKSKCLPKPRVMNIEALLDCTSLESLQKLMVQDGMNSKASGRADAQDGVPLQAPPTSRGCLAGLGKFFFGTKKRRKMRATEPGIGSTLSLLGQDGARYWNESPCTFRSASSALQW